jgi:hypothetical protein
MNCQNLHRVWGCKFIDTTLIDFRRSPTTQEHAERSQISWRDPLVDRFKVRNQLTDSSQVVKRRLRPRLRALGDTQRLQNFLINVLWVNAARRSHSKALALFPFQVAAVEIFALFGDPLQKPRAVGVGHLIPQLELRNQLADAIPRFRLIASVKRSAAVLPVILSTRQQAKGSIDKLNLVVLEQSGRALHNNRNAAGTQGVCEQATSRSNTP